MKALLEIGVSFMVGVGAIWTLAQVRQPKATSIPREENQEDPVIQSSDAEDPALSFSWGLNTIKAPSAWMQERGAKDVVVAVIDTGCDVRHPDLSKNIWRNPGESGLDPNGNPKSANGIDDDENGYIDDVYGWNFADINNDVDDKHGHGTHIAGIIGSSHYGVNKDVSLMILKYYDAHASGSENLHHTIEAIRYAVRNGAKVINYSGGGLMRSPEEEEALRWAQARGVLVVAAAGNEGANSDFDPFYPADYDLPNILSVAAVDKNAKLLPSSNFGLYTVDLAAPGKNIFSTLPNGQYGYLSGTSQATAFASGTAALMLAHDPELKNPEDVIARMLEHAAVLNSLKLKLKSGGVLDANSALANELSIAQGSQIRTRAPARSEN